MKTGDYEDAIRSALARGDLLNAYDLVGRAKADGPEQATTIRYLEVLTLARLGDTDRAWRIYGEYGVGDRSDVDSLALHARLLKDQAFETEEPDLQKLLAACRSYSIIYRRTGSTYPAINAATLARIAGRDKLAAGLARAVVRAAADEPHSNYFSFATVAEALVVLNDMPGARAALSQAMATADANVGARSTTLLQLSRLAATVSDPQALEELLELIKPPKVAMFCGNIFLPDAPLEARLSADVAAVIAAEQVGFAYGALAAGSDILIAEQLLAAGVELNVVLPFAEPDFIQQSVAPSGGDWLQRYGRCMAAATSVTFASKMSYVGDGSQFGYGSKVTMGLAKLRARQLHSESLQLAIIESGRTHSLSGSDVEAWRARGGKTFVVAADGLTRPRMPPTPREAFVQRGEFGLMFTDYPGFSGLDERVLPLFWTQILMRAAEILEKFDKVLESNTWGDALFVVFQDAATAADAAMELCDRLAEVDCRALGVPEGTAMRIALHYGPTYVAHKPGAEKPSFYGSEISLAARIEPVTPAGSVYVTEPFAAVLEMEVDKRFTCNYVGRVSLAKNFGVFPLYRLSRTARSNTQAPL